MKESSDKEARFMEVTGFYKEVVAKVCYLYSSANASFDDLYQEVLINLWQGLDSYRGEAKMSTWIYRTAINTCISWHRRNRRHSDSTVKLDDVRIDIADTSDSAAAMEEYRQLYRLINMLGPVDKALVTLWLDEKPYDEIAAIMGISAGNVAVKMHRIKEKLSKLARTEA
ncbi:MAG: sigma-70 family RNA polymerase sigma factor [Muribaculaceae bacterium]|nr:sigma-70 family RNA polymerase sigma factor [Muribaculaceae bacterium]